MEPALPVSPVTLAYQFHSAGEETLPRKRVNGGMCGKCSQVSVMLTPYRAVVSEKYTQWEDFDQRSPGLCDVCAWAYSHQKNVGWVVHQSGTATRLPLPSEEGLPQLAEMVLPTLAVGVSLHGRKHVLPHLRWGCVTTEYGAVPWTREDAEVYAVMREVVATMGYPRVALLSLVPPPRLVGEVRWWEKWETLNAFRRRSVAWDVAYKGLPLPRV